MDAEGFTDGDRRWTPVLTNQNHASIFIFHQIFTTMAGKTKQARAPKGDAPHDDKSRDESKQHPLNKIDHRPQNGPLLTLLWSEEEPLCGQSLYLGGEVGSDGKIYCIPGHGTCRPVRIFISSCY
jgi:hypothetical protein